MKLPADTGPSLDRDRISTTSNADVRYWHLADIGLCAAHMSAFDPKRTLCSALQRQAPKDNLLATRNKTARPSTASKGGTSVSSKGILARQY
jgi:hypothetical protein